MTSGFPAHAPSHYDCPFCGLARDGCNGVVDENDVVARDEHAMAFISPRWWPNNHGHVLVVPVMHYENLYVLPPTIGHAVQDLVQRLAIAIRQSYRCDGTSTRQHNEPAGNQDVWHFHVHVFPRCAGDGLYASKPLREFVTADQRRPYAQRLRSVLTPGAV